MNGWYSWNKARGPLAWEHSPEITGKLNKVSYESPRPISFKEDFLNFPYASLCQTIDSSSGSILDTFCLSDQHIMELVYIKHICQKDTGYQTCLLNFVSLLNLLSEMWHIEIELPIRLWMDYIKHTMKKHTQKYM